MSKNREFINMINDQLGTSGLSCDSRGELLGTSFCDVADEYYSGVRLNRSNQIEAEFTDQRGHKSYKDLRTVVGDINDLRAKIQNSDPLSVTSPTDTARAEQLANALVGMTEFADKVQSAGLPVNMDYDRIREAIVGDQKPALGQSSPTPPAPTGP